MHAAMHNLTSCNDNPFDVVLIQEPWWQEINSTFTTVSLAGWQLTLLKLNIDRNKCPRTVAYHRLGMGTDMMLRTDIMQDLDFMIMTIGREGATWTPITVINIYNQKTMMNNTDTTQEWTADCLQNKTPHHPTPTVIVGDWNMRDPSWDDGVPSPSMHTRTTLEWLHGASFHLKNKPNVPTREDNNGHASTIDLVFTNKAIINTGSISNVYVDTGIGNLYDHHAITFTIGPPQDEIPSHLDNGLNWKHTDKEEFCKALRHEIDQNQEEHTNTVRELLNLDRKSASETKLDKAVNMIQNYLEQAATKTVPTRQIVQRSKLWWTKDLTKAYKELRSLRGVLRNWMREFHCPSLFLAEQVAQKCKSTISLQCRSVIVDIPVVKNPNSKLGFKLKSYYKNSIWSIILQVFEILASGQFFLEKKVSFFGRC